MRDLDGPLVGDDHTDWVDTAFVAVGRLILLGLTLVVLSQLSMAGWWS